MKRREEAAQATAIDDIRVATEKARRDAEAHESYQNPRGVWIGLAVAIGLLVAGWLVFDSMRCDPFESDIALAHGGACR